MLARWVEAQNDVSRSTKEGHLTYCLGNAAFVERSGVFGRTVPVQVGQDQKAVYVLEVDVVGSNIGVHDGEEVDAFEALARAVWPAAEEDARVGRAEEAACTCCDKEGARAVCAEVGACACRNEEGARVGRAEEAARAGHEEEDVRAGRQRTVHKLGWVALRKVPDEQVGNSGSKIDCGKRGVSGSATGNANAAKSAG